MPFVNVQHLHLWSFRISFSYFYWFYHAKIIPTPFGGHGKKPFLIWASCLFLLKESYTPSGPSRDAEHLETTPPTLCNQVMQKAPPNMPNQTTSHIYKLLKRQPSTSSRISSRTPTCKQVSGNAVQQPSGRLINDITTAFQRKGKFDAGFIDLTDAHDTVWYRGLYLKLLKTLADVSLEKFIILLIQGRSFHIQWDLQQKGSVLAPVFFSIYTADMPHGDSS